MAGSWEVTSGHIQVSILHTWDMHPDFVLSMLRMQKAPFGKPVRVSYNWQHGMPFDLGRNLAAKEFLNSDAEWLFFVDSDIIMPPRVLEMLLEHNMPIVGGLYWRRHPPTHPMAYKFKEGSGTQMDPLQINQISPMLTEVDGIGAGCLLIHRRVFEALKNSVRKMIIPHEGYNTEVYEFFKYAATEPPYLSEDLYFSLICRLANFKIYVDASVNCGHIVSTAMLKDGQVKWTPLETGGQ